MKEVGKHMDKVSEKMRDRQMDIKYDRYQLIFYDENGKRVLTDYTCIEPDEEYINDYYNWLKRAMPNKARRTAFVVVVERKLLFSMRLK